VNYHLYASPSVVSIKICIGLLVGYRFTSEYKLGMQVTTFVTHQIEVLTSLHNTK